MDSLVKKVKKSDLDVVQLAKDAEIARLVHEKELAEMEREREERQRQDQASVDYIASLYDEVQAKIDASEELAARLQMKERDMYIIEERSKLLAKFFERRKKLLAEERAAAVRNKPPTRTQLRSLIMTYLKHTGKYRHNQLNKKTFEKIQALYIKEQERDTDFMPIVSERDEKMIDKMNKKAASIDEEEVPEETECTKAEVKQEEREENIKKRSGRRLKMNATKKSKRQKTGSDTTWGVERAITTDASLDVAQDSDNIFKIQSTALLNVNIPQGIDTGSSLRRQETMGGTLAQTRMEQTFELMDNLPSTPHDLPLTGGYTPRSDKGRMKIDELITLYTKLSKHVLDLEKEKGCYSVEILKPKEKSLRNWKGRKKGRRSDKLKLMFKDKDFEEIDDHIENIKEETVDAATTRVSTASAPVSTVGVTIKTAKPRTPPTTTTVFDDEDLAQRIYEEDLVELERAQQERQRQEDDTNAALAKEFDEIQARIDVDHELAKETIGNSKSRGNKKQTTYKNSSQEQDDYLPQAYGNPAGGSRKKTHARKRTGEKKSEESAKKQKLEDVTEEQESTKSDKEAAVDYEHEKEELRFDWESQNLGSVNMEDLYVYKIIRADGNTSYHKSLSSMLRKFNRQDLVDLHRLVMKRFEDTTLEGYNLLLWGDLKVVHYITDGWYFDLPQHVSREKVSSHQGNAVKDVELEARS
ncbi:hypothetical protein Tco_0488603 [Tanacetum coccineum]